MERAAPARPKYCDPVVESRETDPAASPTSGSGVLIMINTTTEHDGQPWGSLDFSEKLLFGGKLVFYTRISDS